MRIPLIPTFPTFTRIPNRAGKKARNLRMGRQSKRHSYNIYIHRDFAFFPRQRRRIIALLHNYFGPRGELRALLIAKTRAPIPASSRGALRFAMPICCTLGICATNIYICVLCNANGIVGQEDGV